MKHIAKSIISVICVFAFLPVAGCDEATPPISSQVIFESTPESDLSSPTTSDSVGEKMWGEDFTPTSREESDDDLPSWARSGGAHPFTDPETGVEYSTFPAWGSVEVKATFEAHGKYYLVIDRLYDSETGLFPDGTDGIYTLKCSKEHYDAVSAGDLLSGTKEYIVDTKEGFLTDINWNSKGYFLSSQEP